LPQVNPIISIAVIISSPMADDLVADIVIGMFQRRSFGTTLSKTSDLRGIPGPLFFFFSFPLSMRRFHNDEVRFLRTCSSQRAPFWKETEVAESASVGATISRTFSGRSPAAGEKK
jgi:hypothetical protein